jgi:hypothetical protein
VNEEEKAHDAGGGEEGVVGGGLLGRDGVEQHQLGVAELLLLVVGHGVGRDVALLRRA